MTVYSHNIYLLNSLVEMSHNVFRMIVLERIKSSAYIVCIRLTMVFAAPMNTVKWGSLYLVK
jgi:hypothetical protein